MTALLASLGGLLVGLAGGWVLGRRGTPRIEEKAKADAVNAERIRLAKALSKAEVSISDHGQVQEVAEHMRNENRKLMRHVRDLEVALRDANLKVDAEPEHLAVLLAMANKERDAAQAALMQLQGRRTADDVSSPPVDPFGDLPPPDDSDPPA